MEKFVSVWADGKTLPASYIFPVDQRPGDLVGPISSLKKKKSIPIIDLNGDGHKYDHGHLVALIMQASQEFGSFQVINHGLPNRLMDDTRNVFKEFFQLPVEENAKFYSNDDNQKFHLYTSGNEYDKESLHFWRDVLRQKCTPLGDCMPYWPQKPARYREVVGEYVAQVNNIGSRLMELLCEGLGLQPEYFAHKLNLEAHLMVNHYPPCPDPRLTLGLGKHSDRSLITILMQGDVPGLQIFKDGHDWIDVEPIPDALVVIMGCISQVVSNGKLRSIDHQVVTNAKIARESVSMFILPESNCYIEPATSLVTTENPALYRGFIFEEFLKSHAKGRELKNCELSWKPFRIS